MKIPTNKGNLTPEQAFDLLLYAAYVHNRRQAPHIKPESWAKVLPNVPAMERRYEQERNESCM